KSLGMVGKIVASAGGGFPMKQGGNRKPNRPRGKWKSAGGELKRCLPVARRCAKQPLNNSRFREGRRGKHHVSTKLVTASLGTRFTPQVRRQLSHLPPPVPG